MLEHHCGGGFQTAGPKAGSGPPGHPPGPGASTRPLRGSQTIVCCWVLLVEGMQETPGFSFPGADPIPEGSTLVTSSPPETITSSRAG